MVTLMTEDATSENRAYFQKPSSMVDASGSLHRGLVDDKINCFTYYTLGYKPDTV